MGFSVSGSADCLLEWGTRYKVAIGVAKGLQYLHSSCQRRIIHRDITASNILLSEDYEAQVLALVHAPLRLIEALFLIP